MNKIKKIIGLVLVLLITGCGKSKFIMCTSNIKNENQNYELKAKYKIYYKDKYVTKIEQEETYNSEDRKVIDYFDEYKNLEYNNLNDIYGGFTYSMKKDKEFVNIKTTIDMDTLDLKQMIKDGYIDNDYVISGKLTTSGAKYFYESKGSVCSD